MTINYRQLIDWAFPEVVQDYRWQDTALYALSVGLGADPMARDQLRFVYEDNMLALPTMAAVLAGQGFWIRDPGTGIDWQQSLHGEQEIVWHRPLAAMGRITGRMRVDSLIDRGAGKGSILTTCNDLFDAGGTHVASVYATAFNRADGGFGGPAGRGREVHHPPERAPDHVLDLPTLPRAALLYRLNGDDNPLHADPDVAAAAGFPMPILHGLCTYAIAGRALLEAACGWDPSRMKSLRARFSAPVFPGETLRTEIWEEAGLVSYRTTALERNLPVIIGGVMEWA
ncbi:MaoC family dehydratase [Chachezhania sediminis]|uniref:MaoC family dehydratase n=1 Tax=Chachezhania sediminis TaxID=2599291 RepID=UPI00131BBACD|nr:MaoC family dehydratase [Chachezhania sediminis]